MTLKNLNRKRSRKIKTLLSKYEEIPPRLIQADAFGDCWVDRRTNEFEEFIKEECNVLMREIKSLQEQIHQRRS